MYSKEFWNNPDAKKSLKALKIFLMVAGFLALGIALGFFIMFLWNATMASIFDLPTVTYWQAVGLFFLAKLFFGFGGGSQSSRSNRKKRHSQEQSSEVDFSSDKAFKEFWQGEGKKAYEAYLAAGNSAEASKEPK
ncbi:MAG: hypothetical protein COB20_14140 [SAR86 cluster bacterium]|uniref:Uncharacterized protein n=1 Tax=SAR86 cluster bacterium TaxID=2030880 RepID=A0A2A4WWV7_9GAMM|nr:MAG: hypothetical protein COB20_14140 [SAR86 cluster bacterium]